MANTRRTPSTRGGLPQARAAADDAVSAGPAARGRRDDVPRLPPVRLAPREELAHAARVAPLLRAARDLARWAETGRGLAAGSVLLPDAAAAAADLELTPGEVDAAWRVAVATGMVPQQGRPQPPGPGILESGDAEEVLAAWYGALEVMLDADDLDGLATALYTVGIPVRMESLFDAHAAAAGAWRAAGLTGAATPPPDAAGTGAPSTGAVGPDQAAVLSWALEALADLGVVELGTDEDEQAGGLTVALSPLGVWGVHRRLRAEGWHVPVLGNRGRDGAPGLLAALASCDAEDGESEIAAWLGARTPAQAAAELIAAARGGTPGLRGAAFAVLDRIGADAVPAIRAALAEPVLRAHAAVWLHEHGEAAELGPEDRTWLLVDLGAGLLEEADPRDVVAELLPELPPETQAEIVAGLWEVSHPAVTDLLTALSNHHPEPSVARAARKAAFKARSPMAAPGSRSS
ncbi:MAG TPA: hypothetical protein VGQ05_12550 [Streptosporangiaceae bacterium]|nr:hypothetical protein [Streptosporangiaceae bacterium]